MADELRQVLDTNVLTPQHAGKLAGKTTFVTRTLMGRVGRSAVKALYARQYANADVKGLTVALVAALWALLDIVCHAAPRVVELKDRSPRRAMVYADAFVRVGEKLWSLAESEEFADKFQNNNPGHDGIEDNGFGMVIFPCEENKAPLYIFGKVPKAVLMAFAQKVNTSSLWKH